MQSIYQYLRDIKLNDYNTKQLSVQVILDISHYTRENKIGASWGTDC